MATTDTVVAELKCVQGEDVAWQMFWTDEYGEPVPIAEPALMDVKDANGQIALRFATNTDPTIQAYIAISGPSGFFQFTAPSALTRQLVPGRYEFDLFAAVADSAIFAAQLQQVISGFVVVGQRRTKIEDAAVPASGGS